MDTEAFYIKEDLKHLRQNNHPLTPLMEKVIVSIKNFNAKKTLHSHTHSAKETGHQQGGARQSVKHAIESFIKAYEESNLSNLPDFVQSGLQRFAKELSTEKSFI